MRVVIADDDAVVVESLRIVLDAQPDIEVAGCGTDGADAVRLAAEAAPDVVLLDIQMPGVDGLAAAEQILAASQPPRVVFLTTFSDDEYIVRALSLGAAGYLIKQDVAGVAPALRAVMAGRSVLEGEVLERAVALGAGGATGASGASGATAEKPDLATIFPQLTDREREVVALIAEGLDNREVAAAAYMGEGTVRNHISSILAKLHLRNRTQIAVAYWRALR
ncbi:response regulator transcription factor [Olsenella uli]|uniref:response regulator transcription factor n=1 Tax=Olsenella uli TaxID=133926 RepID=UPI00195E617E|nr:response regulator transcription factor [Olsenella uli]MBM6816317.1 response regulator transcription factor [Olsenella uli]